MCVNGTFALASRRAAAGSGREGEMQLAHALACGSHLILGPNIIQITSFERREQTNKHKDLSTEQVHDSN